jgi:hypothetical protein
MKHSRLMCNPRIYSEKLRRVDVEMKMVQDGTHPEFVAQKACVDQKLEEKVRLADAHYKYSMESLAIATRVNRAQVHSQYFQGIRQIRENALEKCSQLWYQIQRERRAGDALVSGLSFFGNLNIFMRGHLIVTHIVEFSYRISDRMSTSIKQRQQYNWEVALLSGISKHIGFPAAPDVLGASEEEVVDDLESMGVSIGPLEFCNPSFYEEARIHCSLGANGGHVDHSTCTCTRRCNPAFCRARKNAGGPLRKAVSHALATYTATFPSVSPGTAGPTSALTSSRTHSASPPPPPQPPANWI